MARAFDKDPGRRVLQEAQRKRRKDPRAAGRPAPDAGRPAGGSLRGRALSGLVLGMLLWWGLQELGVRSLPVFRVEHLLPAAGGVGALLALTRARVLLWIAGTAVCGVALLVAYTPFIGPAVRSLARADPLERVEAVVVLSSDIRKTGEPSDAAMFRQLRAFELLHQGYARRLVLTRLPAPKPSYVPAARRQMTALGLQYPIEETLPVRNTRDEAVVVARLARARGWKTIILVSEPFHMRRAAAAFEKRGLRVLCSPCRSRHYDLVSLQAPDERLAAFRDWLHETVGYEVYRRNGWL